MKTAICTFLAIGAALLWTAPVRAEAPRVVADIAPVHSLVAQVMAGQGTPELLLPPGSSPHGYALRPSEARALAEADLVFRVGAGLTPWLDRSLATLGAAAVQVPLAEAPGVIRRDYREGPVFGTGEDHDHDGGAEHSEDHDADHGHDHGHDHDHAAGDPHVWLDPRNADAMLAAIAAHLAEADPANAAAYRANAEAARARLAVLEEEIAARLAPLRGRAFVVFHDAYHHFEERFGLTALGALSDGDAAGPGPARLAALRDALRAAGAVCLFTEPQLNPRLADALTEGSGMRAGLLDPLGAAQTPGPELYPALMRALAENMARCLGKA